MQNRAKLFYGDKSVLNLNRFNDMIIAGEVSTNVLFWSLHTLSFIIYLLPVYINTIEIQGFTHGSLHKVLAINSFFTIVLSLGLLRSLFNKFISWNHLKISEFIKSINIIICLGVFYHIVLVLTTHFIDNVLYSEQSIPEIFALQYKYVFLNSFMNVLLWGIAFFALKVILNFNQNKLEFIDLEVKLKEHKINSVKKNIDPDFLMKCLKISENTILEDVAVARDQLLQLSNILRYTLSTKNKNSMRWQEELSFIDSYLRFKIKVENKNIDYSINITDEILPERATHFTIYDLIKDLVMLDLISLSLFNRLHNGVPQLIVKIKIDTSNPLSNEQSFFKNLDRLETEYNSYIQLSYDNDFHVMIINLEHEFIAQN